MAMLTRKKLRIQGNINSPFSEGCNQLVKNNLAILLQDIEQITEELKPNAYFNEKITKKYLWFVNIGGYDPSSMQEKHEFGLVVAKSSLDAKNKAKSKWLIGYEKKHKDDIASIEILINCL